MGDPKFFDAAKLLCLSVIDSLRALSSSLLTLLKVCSSVPSFESICPSSDDDEGVLKSLSVVVGDEASNDDSDSMLLLFARERSFIVLMLTC